MRRRLVAQLLVGALPGVAGGAVLLSLLGKAPLQVAVGVLVLVAVGLQLRRPASILRERPASGRATAAVGLATGLLTTSTGTNGPPMVLWFDHLGLAPAERRDTLFVSFTALGLFGTTALLLSGSWTLDGIGAGGLAVLIALSLSGRALGWLVFRRLPAEAFRTVGLVLIAVLGAVSLASGVLG